MVGIPCWVEAAFCAATAEAPHRRWSRAGRDPGRAFGAPRSGTSDALFPAEVQSFLDNFITSWGRGHSTTPSVESPQSSIPVTIPIGPPPDNPPALKSG